MRLAYLGLPQGALALARAGHDLLAVGLNRPLPDRAGKLLPRNCPILLRPDVTVPAIGRLFLTSGADLLVCYLWDRLLPGAFFSAFPQQALAYHPSLLPRHRGADPCFWTLWSGDTRAGVTIFRPDAGVDTGAVAAQHSVAVPPDATGGALADLLDPLGLELLLRVLDDWERSGPPSFVPQDGSAATEAPAPDDGLLALQWSDGSAAELVRLVRAASPHPGAFTVIDGRGESDPTTVVVLDAHALELEEPGALEPGDAVLTDDGVTVWTAGGGLVLDVVTVEGGRTLRSSEQIAALFPGIADLRPI